MRNEQNENQLNNDFPDLNVHDMMTGDNESPNPVPEFLTGRIPSRTHLNQSYEDIHLDTTIPAHERIGTAADPDPITRLADVLTTMQKMTEQMKINHFYSLLRKNALQTFRNINSRQIDKPSKTY